MIYLIIGNENLIKDEIKEIKEKKNINKNSIASYDIETSSIEEAIIDIQTISLFDEKKLVIIKNTDLITTSDMLENYLQNKNENILIFTSNKALDKRKKILKQILESSIVIDKETTSLFDFIKNEINGYKINNMDINLIIEYCNKNKDRIKNELDKLKMYKLEEKEINRDDIKKLVKKDTTSNVFSLIESINQKNKKRINELFYELVRLGEDEIKLLSIIASNFRLVLQVKKMIKDKNDDEIIKLYNMKPYRLKKIKEQSYLYSEEELIKFLKFFGKIDENIKKGVMDKSNFINELIAFI